MNLSLLRNQTFAMRVRVRAKQILFKKRETRHMFAPGRYEQLDNLLRDDSYHQADAI